MVTIKNVGDSLRVARELNGLSLRDVATATWISNTHEKSSLRPVRTH